MLITEVMFNGKKKILIIDEDGFSRICSAILKHDGYHVKTITNIDNLAQRLHNAEFGLIVASYPYSALFLERIKKKDIPILILSDKFDNDLLNALEGLNNTCCMIKPLDYQKFRSLVKGIMCGSLDFQGGYSIV